MISLEKLNIFSPLQKLPKNVVELGKLIALKSCPKSNKSPNLVTLATDSASQFDCLGGFSDFQFSTISLF